MKDIPIYSQNAEYAREHDEFDAYRAYSKADVVCKKAIEEEWQVVEPCPHCGSENIWYNLDPEACGYITKCGECGRKIFLCDECQHADDAKDCDWHEENRKSICFRGVIVKEAQ